MNVVYLLCSIYKGHIYIYVIISLLIASFFDYFGIYFDVEYNQKDSSWPSYRVSYKGTIALET